MRRSASEIIRNLEGRIARLESRKTSRTAGGFNGQTAKVDVDTCVIMLDTHDSSERFHYCFMHLEDSILDRAVKSFIADMKVGQRMGIIESVRITSGGDNSVSITLDFSEESEDLQMESDSNVDWIIDNCWHRPNTINIG